MPEIEQPLLRNQLLAKLSPEDFAWLAPHLRRADMPFRVTLQPAGEPIASAIFPEHGYASMLATLEDGDAAEVGMIGFEGMIGLPLVFGTDRSSVEAMVQSAGSAVHLPAEVLQQSCEERPALRALMLRYAMAFNVQVMMTAACNGRHLVEQRLARWLLMAHDRTEGDEFAMTHEFLSTMLAVRRAGITVAAGVLQRAGYIRYEQGRIRVIDRRGLETAACECHGIVRRETERLMGPPRPR
jgi:CRP-like cAMP-binding protein